jgi:hypothetical protein
MNNKKNTIHYKKFDASLLNIKRDVNRRITFDVSYGDGLSLILSTPKLKCHNDLFWNEEIKIEREGYIDIEIPDTHMTFYNVFSQIDQFIIDYALQNSEEYFEKKLPKYKIEEIYKPSIKLCNPKQPGYLRVKVYPDNIKIFDKNENQINYELSDIVKKDDTLMLSIKLQNVRISKSLIKCNWTAYQIKIGKSISECEIYDTDEEVNAKDDTDDDSDNELN